MTRRRGTYFGGSTIIIPDNRPHDVRLAEAKRYHKRKAERAQRKFDREAEARRKHVEKILQEDPGRKGSSAKRRAKNKYRSRMAKNMNSKQN